MGCRSLLQGNFPDPGIELRSPALQADSLPSEPPGKPLPEAEPTLNSAHSSNKADFSSQVHSQVHSGRIESEQEVAMRSGSSPLALPVLFIPM